jgi:ABC-type uncharacterized transport system involved in gliding motility auxiliary subunit
VKVTRNVRIQLLLQKIIFVVLVLTAVGLLGWLSHTHTAQFDWTSNKLNTLSQSSIDLLNTLEHPVHITIYAQVDDTVHAAIEEIMRRYQRAKKDFSFKVIDPGIDFESAQRDGVERYNQVVVKYNDKKEIISSLSEQTVSNALLRLSRPGSRKVVFLKGHGERSIGGDDSTSYKTIVAELSTKGFSVQANNLLLSALPADTAVLVLAAPARELLEGEIDHIKTYIEDGGNLLWMMDPGEMQNTGRISETLGIRFLPGVIVDNNPNLRKTLGIQHPAMVPALLDGLAHPITEDIPYNALFPISRGVEQTGDDFEATDIARSLPDSWSEVSALGSEIAYEPDNGDIKGPVGIVLALERTIENDSNKASQRVIVAGDSDFLATRYIGAGTNLSLALNIFNWLAGDDDLITVETKSAPDIQLQLSDSELLLIEAVHRYLLPAVLIFAGVFIWLRRRKG